MDIGALERLAALRESGAISEAEFLAAKSRVLAGQAGEGSPGPDATLLAPPPLRRRRSDLEKYPWLGGVLGALALAMIAIIAFGWLSERGSNSPTEITYSMGQAIPVTSEISTKIESVRTLPGVLFSKGDSARYVVIVFENENVSGRPLDGVRKPSPILIDPDGNRYERDWGAEGEVRRAANIGGQFGLLDDLTPGLPETAFVAFLVSTERAAQSGWTVTMDKNDKVRVPVSLSVDG